jgi:hypothetical protein
MTIQHLKRRIATSLSIISHCKPNHSEAANQLRDQLATLWPGAAKMFCSVDSWIALAFLRRYPSPLDARGLGEQRLDAFLKRNGASPSVARPRV